MTSEAFSVERLDCGPVAMPSKKSRRLATFGAIEQGECRRDHQLGGLTLADSVAEVSSISLNRSGKMVAAELRNLCFKGAHAKPRREAQ